MPQEFPHNLRVHAQRLDQSRERVPEGVPADFLGDAGPDVVIVTKGSRGVTLSSREVGIFDMPASAVLHVENPIGAWDCFAAIFLACSVSGHSVHESASRAIKYTEDWLREGQQSHSFEETH